MSDETIRAYERELRRQGEDVMVLRWSGGTERATSGECRFCRIHADQAEVRTLDLSGSGSYGGWVKLCRLCIEALVARVIDPQSVARLQSSNGLLYIRIEERR